jgi:hypothetical protein
MIQEGARATNQYGGDDDFYEACLGKLAARVAGTLPNSTWKKPLSKVRVVQFDSCKLHSVLLFELSGLCGSHGRTEKDRAVLALPASAADAGPEGQGDEVEEEAEIYDLLRCEKKKRSH